LLGFMKERLVDGMRSRFLTDAALNFPFL